METNELTKISERLSKIEEELKNKSKDSWDKINIGSSLLVPILVVVIGGIIAFRQNQNTLQADLETRNVTDKNEDLTRQSTEAQTIEMYIPHLISTNDYERKVSLAVVRNYYENVGARLLELSATSDPAKSNQLSAQKIINSRTSTPVIAEVSLIGNWPLIRGDSEMNTGGNDHVQVVVASRLVKTIREVVLEVDYRIQEDGGDHTTFSGTRRKSLFTAPKNMAIASINATGGLSAHFSTFSIGKQHDFQTLDSGTTYWRKLEYRVDSPGKDSEVVGLRGSVAFDVELEALP